MTTWTATEAPVVVAARSPRPCSAITAGSSDHPDRTDPNTGKTTSFNSPSPLLLPSAPDATTMAKMDREPREGERVPRASGASLDASLGTDGQGRDSDSDNDRIKWATGTWSRCLNG
jgi:hypothetical protein